MRAFAYGPLRECCGPSDRTVPGSTLVLKSTRSNRSAPRPGAKSAREMAPENHLLLTAAAPAATPGTGDEGAQSPRRRSEPRVKMAVDPAAKDDLRWPRHHRRRAPSPCHRDGCEHRQKQVASASYKVQVAGMVRRSRGVEGDHKAS